MTIGNECILRPQVKDEKFNTFARLKLPILTTWIVCNDHKCYCSRNVKMHHAHSDKINRKSISENVAINFR